MSYSDIGLPGRTSTTPQIFLSYRSVDDEPPPGRPDGRYVKRLLEQLNWELRQQGAADAVFWMDRNKIYPGDKWSDILLNALGKADLFLALLSKNYIKSEWCATELSKMSARITSFPQDLRNGRIFRADKNRVPDEQINEALKGIQAVRFFELDRNSDREVEFYYGGQFQDEAKYCAAVHELAVAISRRLEALGVGMTRRPATNGRTVFVAKPSADTKVQYQHLVEELQGSGYRVVPDPGEPLPESGAEVKLMIVDGLGAAELSIHLLGERRGFRPDGLGADTVPFQLACAADEVNRRPSFYRLIWAPKALPTDDEALEKSPREPLEVLARFDAFLPSDHVEGDTAERFNEFVFQRLESKAQPEIRTVYIHYTDNDRRLALDVFNSIDENKRTRTIRPREGSPKEIEDAMDFLTRDAQLAVLCWENASEAAMIKEIGDSALGRWRAADAKNRSILLLMGPPGSDAKSDAVKTKLAPGVAHVIDATSGGDLASMLAPYLD